MASREEVRRVSIFINGTEADLTLKQLQAGATRLRNELGRLVPGTEAFKAKMMELRQVRRVIQDVENDIKGVGGAFGWLKTEVGKLGTLATGFLGLQFVTSQFRDIISQNAKLADSITDIQKTTGMSEMAVRRLQRSFKELNTRTSTSELNSLAEVAGKLGITGEREVMGFVRAADQINVALGKNLGNAEDAINSLGKITELFHVKDQYGLEQALLKTGSAITDLGNAGTANEGFIVQFTQRLGGIAPQAKMALPDILALGSLMDELGQEAQASSTAIGQFVLGMGKDIPKYAGIAKMSVADFTKLLSEDGTKALVTVLQNAKSAGVGVAGLADSMGMIGEDGARGVAALGALSNNLELLKVRMKQSNESFNEGTTLTETYEIKNKNFAATLDRLSKKFNALTANASLTDFLTGAVKATDSFITGLNKCMGFITGMIKMLTMGGVAWLTYSTYVAIAKSQTLAFMVNLIAGDAIMQTSRVTTIALAGAKALLSGNLAKASQAMRLFNIATEANPIGAVVAAIMAAVTAFALFGDTVSQNVRIQNSITDINAAAEKSYYKEKTALESAMNVLKQRTKSKEDEARAIATLREIMPDHLKGYKDEEIAAGKATDAINKNIDAIMRKARAAAASKRIEELTGENIDLASTAKKGWEGLSDWEKMKTGLAMTAKHGALTNRGVKDAWFKELHQQKTNNDQEITELMSAYGKDINYSETPALNFNDGTGSAGAFDLKNATKDQLDQQLEKDTKAIAQLKQGTEEYNKVAAEMVAIRKRLKDIAKDTGAGGGNQEESDAKKAAAAYKKLLEQAKDLSGKALEDTLSKNAKELHDADQKYQKLIDKEKEFLKMKGTTAAQRDAITKSINQLEVKRGEDLENIRVRQEAEMGQKIKELRNSLSQVYDTELDKETNRINNFYDDLQDKAADYDEWILLEESRQKDLADAKIREAKRFGDYVDEIRQQGVVLGASADEQELAQINKKYDDQIEALKKKFGIEKELTAEQQAAIDLINKNRKTETKKLDQRKAKEQMQFEVETAQKVSDAIFTIGSRNSQAQTDLAIQALEAKKDKELQNKDLTEEQKRAIDEKYAKQEAEIKRKAWEAQKQADLEQAIINGALAVAKALAQVGPLGAFVIPGIIAETAAQVAVIASQQTPAFEDGGYSAVDYKKPQGWVKSPTLFKNSASGRNFTAGEKYKTEYIISSEQLKDPVVSDFVSAMEANRGVRRFEAGGYSNATGKIKQPVTVSNTTMPQQHLDITPVVEELKRNREAIANIQLSWSWQMYQDKKKQIEQIVSRANG